MMKNEGNIKKVKKKKKIEIEKRPKTFHETKFYKNTKET